MNAFPAFIPLYDARILIVGDGEAADAKARLVAGSIAEVVRAPEARALEPGLYDGFRLVFLAIPDKELAWKAWQAAKAAGALTNVVDFQHLGDFHTPSIVDRSPVICAIGTGGAAPVFATLLRSSIEARWPKGLGAVARLSAEIQTAVREAIPDQPARRAYWRRMLKGPAADAAMAGDMDGARALALEAIEHPRQEGRVLFLQAPPRAELLTLAALRALGAADRIVAEGGAAAEVLGYARRDAERRASATAEELARWAAEGLAVLVLSTDLEGPRMEAVRALGARAEALPVAH